MAISNLTKTHSVVGESMKAQTAGPTDMQQLHFLQHMQMQLKYSSYTALIGKWVWVHTDWYNDRCQNVTWHTTLYTQNKTPACWNNTSKIIQNKGPQIFQKIYKPSSNYSCQNWWHEASSLLMTQNSWITSKFTIIWCFQLSACDLSHISVCQEQKNCNKYAENNKYVIGSWRLMPPDALQPKAYCTNPGL